MKEVFVRTLRRMSGNHSVGVRFLPFSDGLGFLFAVSALRSVRPCVRRRSFRDSFCFFDQPIAQDHRKMLKRVNLTWA